MSEGDAVHRTAAALRSALADRKMLRFDAPRLVGVTPKAGRIIERVESHGKHLEIEWDDGVVLHTNMRLHGSWHLYRTGEPWRRPHRDLRVVIEAAADPNSATTSWTAVCFNAPVVETYRARSASRHPGLGGLGPNLSVATADLDRCVDMLMSYHDPMAPIADVLVDQTVFCGLGNVYRSEVLWACELSPRAAVGDLSEPLAQRIVSVAARLLRANFATAQRVTVAGVPGGRAVYGRTSQGCFRCGESVRARAFGSQQRVLYWCPGCQTRHAPPVMVDDTPTDQHPAARLFLEELRQNRAM